MALPAPAHSDSIARPAVASPWLIRRGVELGAWAVLGAYTVMHLWGLLPMAFGGRPAFDAARGYRSAPAYGLLVSVVIIPVALVALGMQLQTWRQQRNLVRRYPTRGTWAAAAYRVTGVLGLGFAAWHGAQLRWLPMWHGLRVDAAWVAGKLSSTLVLDLYLMGAAVVGVHLGLLSWRHAHRLTAEGPPRVKRFGQALCVLLALLVTALGALCAAAFHDPRYVLAP